MFILKKIQMNQIFLHLHYKNYSMNFFGKIFIWIIIIFNFLCFYEFLIFHKDQISLNH